MDVFFAIALIANIIFSLYILTSSRELWLGNAKNIQKLTENQAAQIETNELIVEQLFKD